MSRIFKFILSLSIFLSACSGVFAQKERLFFIGQQKDSIEGYLQEVGVPDGFMIYTSIQDVEGLDSSSDKGAGIQHAQEYVNKYPECHLQLGLYLKNALSDILAGKYDANIFRLGEWIRKSQRSVYVRIGYEFDLPDNGYQPAEYQRAYRYIVDHLRKKNVANAYYVWHSAAMAESKRNVMDWYPGDDYVDWFGVSFFSPGQVAVAQKFNQLAKEHHKPMMVAEATPAGMYTFRGKVDWFKHFFQFIQRNDIQIVCYINSHWDSYPMFKDMKWGDARIQKHPELKDLWLSFMSGR